MKDDKFLDNVVDQMDEQNLNVETANGAQLLDLALSDVQKQLAKFGREQFKLNTLVETQQKQMQSALQLLIENDARHERERAELLAQRSDLLSQDRLKLIERLLPTLDGLDEAIAAYERTLNAPAKPTFFQRLLSGTPTLPQAEVITAWHNGLILIRERFLTVLAEENVQPMNCVGQPFDPSLHVAVEQIAASGTLAIGMITREIRRGYLVDDMPLRYAEVAVAR